MQASATLSLFSSRAASKRGVHSRKLLASRVSVKGRTFATRKRCAAKPQTKLPCRAQSVASPPIAIPEDQEFSGLQGQALLSAQMEFPPKKEILAAIPEECFKRDTARSLLYAVVSTSITVGLGVAAAMLIPMKMAWLPAWLAYAYVAGTAATGCWVVAHECGHGAFSDNRTIQDTVGYVLHTLLLVPYFSWQRSHAVHHSRTNHMEEGETHVPPRADSPDAIISDKVEKAIGENAFAIVHTISVLLFGWPMYLLFGASGGPVRGKTNHFNPHAGAKGKHALFPAGWKQKVWQSDLGIAAFVAGLVAWGVSAGSAWPVLALYGGPYLVCNAWLVMYTWLQHTDVDVPHFGSDDWNWSKGTFMTIDRPYGFLFDFLHHRIGSTHVVHHLNHQIPHYHALKATEAIKEKYPQFYLYDPTPIPQVLWRVGKKCNSVEQRGNMWVWKTNSTPATA